MRRQLILLLTLVGAMLFACSGGVLAQQTTPAKDSAKEDKSSKEDSASKVDFVDGEILVKFKDSVSNQAKAQTHEEKGGEKDQTIPKIDADVVEVPSGEEEQKVAEYESDPNVEFAEVNGIWQAGFTPNDPQVNQQWQYNNTGQTGGTNDADIDAFEAWDKTRSNNTVRIAVLDTGIDQSHEDLASQLVAQKNFTTATSGVEDKWGHGTHVAGSAVAIGNNSKGVAGVCQGCALMNGKVLGDDGSGQWEWIAYGIGWAVDPNNDGNTSDGAKVINMSIIPDPGCNCSGYSQIVEDTVNYAWSKGVVVVASAGNHGASTQQYPGAYTNAIGVANTDHNDTKANNSAWGSSWVDVAAPGTNILSTAPDHSNGIWGTGVKYGTISGTSMASPHVAGLAGLIWSKDGLCTTNTCVRKQIENQADRISGTGTYWAKGRINANKSVLIDQPPFIWKRGSQGSGNEQFYRPYGVATGSSGYVYVADTQNNRIQMLNSNGDFIRWWGGQGSATGQFYLPYDVATDSSGSVYVSEYGTRIQKFDANGNYRATLGRGFGTGEGQFAYPQGVATDSSGNIYVADTGNSRIQKFDSNRNLVWQKGSSGNGNGQFNIPTGIATDSSGNVYVADTQNNRIQKFNSTSGAYVGQWGSSGNGNTQFGPNSPSGVDTDSAGNVYVTDSGNHRIQKFTSSGDFLTEWGSQGSSDNQFNTPDGIATDPSGNVYVAEWGNNRIQKFGYGRTAPASPTNDNFINAQFLSGAPVTVTGSNQDATKEAGEPNHYGNSGGKSAWYEWTPQASGTTVIDTAGSDFDTLLAVYTGSAVNALTEVASNDDADGGRQSKVRFTVTAGATYRIAVDGYNTGTTAGPASGNITLNLETPDTTAPDPPVIDSPSDNSFDNDGDFTVSGTAEADSTIELFDDTTSEDTTQADANGDWAIELSGIAEGEHTYTAKATDDAGNTSAVSNTVAVTVDTAEPDTTIDSGPSGTTSSGSARFAFSSSESGVTFQCSLDEAAFEDCSSPKDYSGLVNGEHTFRVKATDRAGNTGPEASRTWTVNVPPPDTTAPTGSVSINNGAKTTRSLNVTLALSATDSGSGVEQMCISNTATCSSWQAYSTSKSWKLSGKSVGTKTVYVQYKDKAGNVSTVFRDTIKYAR